MKENEQLLDEFILQFLLDFRFSAIRNILIYLLFWNTPKRTSSKFNQNMLNNFQNRKKSLFHNKLQQENTT